MKWESSDLTVGIVVVTAVLITLGALLTLSPAVGRSTYPLYAEFDRIDGIDRQASVYLRGYPIGRVDAIEPVLDDEGGLGFRVRMNIRARLASGDSLLLPQGTRARLVPPAVIGAGTIVLEPPGTGGPRLQPGDTLVGLRATDVVHQVRTLTTDLSTELVATLGTARVLLDTLTRTVAVANETVARVNAGLPPVLEGLREEVAAAQELTREMHAQLIEIAPAATASLDSVRALLSDSRRLLRDADGMLARREPELAGILANLDSTTILLHHFVREVSERPLRLITGVDPPAGLSPIVVPAVAPAETASTHRP